MIDDNGNIVFGADGKTAWLPLGITGQQFVAAGLRANGTTMALSNLVRFKQGGDWDLQRLTGGSFNPKFTSSATIVIGLYAAAAGIKFTDLMTYQSIYGAIFSHWSNSTDMDAVYPYLPATNVANTVIGYNLFKNKQIGSGS
jgi:hypothetical protein